VVANTRITWYWQPVLVVLPPQLLCLRCHNTRKLGSVLLKAGR
jgi:hypothetical protein